MASTRNPTDSPPARRGNGEGSIFYDEQRERWVGLLDLGCDAQGKRVRRKVSAKTKTEAARKLHELRKAEGLGLDVSQRAPLVSELARDWLVKVAPQRKAPSTMGHVRIVVERHIIPGVGSYRVDQLRPEHVEAWLAEHSAEGKARATVERYRGLLVQILGWAQRRKLVAWNVAAASELPLDAKPARAKRSLTPEQAGALLEVLADDRMGPYFTLLLLCGLRPGEADALAWEDLDLDAGTVHVWRALQRASGGRPLTVGPTKTKKARTLALADAAIAALKRQRAQQARERLASGDGWTDNPQWRGLVFTTEVGTPFYPSRVRWYFDRACQRAGLPAFTPYELRHSAASLMVAAGMEPFEVQDQLGHADLRMLERHYRHRLTPVVSAGVPAMEGILNQEGNK